MAKDAKKSTPAAREGEVFDTDGRIMSALIPPELLERIRVEQAEAAKSRKIIDQANAPAPTPTKKRKKKLLPIDHAERMLETYFPHGYGRLSIKAIHKKLVEECEQHRLEPWGIDTTSRAKDRRAEKQ